jgi:long-subunit fatty acid transport protein
MHIRDPLIALALALALFITAPAAAQAPAPPATPVTAPPVSLLLPNYNSVPVGEVAALEGGAFVARANDGSAGFYNPAGLAHAEQSSISGTAGAYQLSSVTPEGLTNIQSSFQQIPSQLSVVVNDLFGRENWAGGFIVTRTNAWRQAVDAVGTRSITGRETRLRFSTDATYDSWLGSLGVGYAASDRLRVGASIDGEYTFIARRQAITVQSVSNTDVAVVSLGSLGDASASHLRATVGAQYRLTPTIQIGAVLRTPGLGLTSSGDASLDGVVQAGTTTATSGFFDPDSSVEYRLPLAFKAGAAWIGTRGQVEFDVLTYSGTGEYTAIESRQPVTTVVDGGQGVPPVSSQVAYQGARVDSRAVVNVAIGGRYRLWSNRSWLLHGGYASDRSPVGANDAAFTKVDLQHVTVGLSGRTKLFLGSLGLRYSTGETGPMVLGASTDGDQFETTFKVSSLGLVYSIALLF